MKARSTWPPRIPRLPLEAPFTEDGDPYVDWCHWHPRVRAVVRVPVTRPDGGGQRWEPVCDVCADQIDTEWRCEL